MALDQTITTPMQRSDWNDYLGNLNGQDVSEQTLAAHKDSNPDFSITPQMLPQIQAEHAAIRTGDSFGNLNADQLQKARLGMSDDFKNATGLSQSYYPTFKKGGEDYGTDLETYAGGGSPIDTSKPLPRPDMSSSQARLSYLKNLASLPGNSFVHGRGDYILNVNKVPQYGTMTFHDSAVNAAKKVGLDPSLLYSSAQEEGASGLVPDEKGEISTAEEQNPDYPVSGFANYGLDNFAGNFKEMVKRGYLPKDFDFKPEKNTNELGQKVMSGVFKNTEDAMMAKAAYVRLEQDNLDDWTKKNGISNLSPTARQFFTLIAFNGGPGTAHKLINYYKGKGLLDGDKFLQSPPDKSVDPGGAYGHVLPRLQMANLLRQQKYFD